MSFRERRRLELERPTGASTGLVGAQRIDLTSRQLLAGEGHPLCKDVEELDSSIRQVLAAIDKQKHAFLAVDRNVDVLG